MLIKSVFATLPSEGFLATRWERIHLLVGDTGSILVPEDLQALEQLSPVHPYMLSLAADLGPQLTEAVGPTTRCSTTEAHCRKKPLLRLQ